MAVTSSKQESKKDEAYLTKRLLKRAVRKGTKEASRKAMETAGSVVVTKGDWVVREYKDGRIERIEKLDKTSSNDIKHKLSKLAG